MGCEMKDYKRLTKWSELGTLHVFDISGETVTGYIPHWATCPAAKSFKKGKGEVKE